MMVVSWFLLVKSCSLIFLYCATPFELHYESKNFNALFMLFLACYIYYILMCQALHIDHSQVSELDLLRLYTHICIQASFHSRCPSSGKSLLSCPAYTVLEDMNSEQFLQCCGSLLALSYRHPFQAVHKVSLKNKLSYGRNHTKYLTWKLFKIQLKLCFVCGNYTLVIQNIRKRETLDF